MIRLSASAIAILTSLMGLSLTTIPAMAETGALDLSGYKLTYDDEFNGFAASPDGSKGYKTIFPFGDRTLSTNAEQQYYSDASVGVDPFRLENGALTIHAAPGSNPKRLPYNSGLITTERTFTQTYGYFEMRAKLAKGPGMWSGFWLLPTDKSWPPEIDVLEAFGAPNANKEGAPDSIHVNAITKDYPSGGGGGWEKVPADVFAGYHTYGVDWKEDTITFYFDGKPVRQVKTPSDMHKPMFMLANLAVGGKWPGPPAGESADMKIDYLRAYSSDPNARAVEKQAVSSPDGNPDNHAAN
jgi:beta-glucanase (GH16 family)